MVFVSLIVVFCKIFTKNQPELFPYGDELLTLSSNIALATIAASIFYALQFFHTASRIRKIALTETKQIIARALSIFQDIFVSTLTTKEHKQTKFDSIKDFLNQNTAKQINLHFNLEAEANHRPKITWANRLAMFGREIKEDTNSIAAKYSPYLSDEMLIFLHELHRHPLTASLVILDNAEVLNFMKKYSGRAYLPMNFLEDFFQLMLRSIRLGVEINFSDSFLKSQKGLIGKARL